MHFSKNICDFTSIFDQANINTDSADNYGPEADFDPSTDNGQSSCHQETKLLTTLRCVTYAVRTVYYVQ